MIVKINSVGGIECKFMDISQKVEQKDREMENRVVKHHILEKFQWERPGEVEEDVINKLIQETFSASEAMNHQLERSHRAPARRMKIELTPGT